MRTSLLKIISVILLLHLLCNRLQAQYTHFQTFMLSADSFYPNQKEAIHLDWRLDLGITAIPLDLSPPYLFTAGFFQPITDRFLNSTPMKNDNSAINIRYNSNGYPILLFSTETDLMIYGYQVFDLQGNLVLKDQTKFASSYLAKPINISHLSNGVYIMLVFYLPESMATIDNQNYWIKNIKMIKQ